jgi:hypothetical protein
VLFFCPCDLYGLESCLTSIVLGAVMSALNVT